MRLLLLLLLLPLTSGFFLPPAPARTFSLSANTVLNFGGKKISVREGSPLKAACAKAGFKPKYNCKKGDCGSCVVSVGGTRMKP
ncbi:hypothetical protein TeGR_g14544, partial [Tetraparma gracilis]